MAKALINKKTGLVDYPVFPCVKGEGLCKVRTQETDRFECVFEPGKCLYRIIKKETER